MEDTAGVALLGLRRSVVGGLMCHPQVSDVKVFRTLDSLNEFDKFNMSPVLHIFLLW